MTNEKILYLSLNIIDVKYVRQNTKECSPYYLQENIKPFRYVVSVIFMETLL